MKNVSVMKLGAVTVGADISESIKLDYSYGISVILLN